MGKEVRGVVLRAAFACAFAMAVALPAGSPGRTWREPNRPGPAPHVIPFPGTPDVTPGSQVIFSSLRPGDLKAVRVIGSRSGAHRGHLALLPDGGGTAFSPARPFVPGERVVVRAILSSPAAGTASGERGATRLSFWFRTGRADTTRGSTAGARAQRMRPPPSRQSFHSARDLHPPVMNFGPDPDRESGDVLLTAQNGTPGPMILNSQGKLVWFRPVRHGVPMNLQVQAYGGHPVLTWWQGVFRNWGRDTILDSSYRTVAVVRGGNGLIADLHEFRITPRGTALLDAYHQARADLRPVGGPRNGRVLDCIIQELDIRTGKVLWEWHALGHVPLTASHAALPHDPSLPFDYFHLNSIQELPDGNLLISARNTWAVYKINRSTGRIMWTLGGKRSSFSMGLGTGFEWQHSARLQDGVLSLFDDGAAPQKEAQSSAKLLKVNEATRSVRLVRRYVHSPPLLANSAGSAQVLPNGNIFVGWGPQPYFSEYAPGGHQIFDGRFAWGTASYRAFRSPWTAQPATPPAMALAPGSNGGLLVYGSWNGATDVSSWRVLGGPSPHDLRPWARRPRTGFETRIRLRGRPRYLAIQALGGAGRVLGASTTRPSPAAR